MQNTFSVQSCSLQNNNQFKILTKRRTYNSESFTSKSRCVGQNKTWQREAPDSGEGYDQQLQRNANEKSKADQIVNRIYMYYSN